MREEEQEEEAGTERGVGVGGKRAEQSVVSKGSSFTTRSPILPFETSPRAPARCVHLALFSCPDHSPLPPVPLHSTGRAAASTKSMPVRKGKTPRGGSRGGI